MPNNPINRHGALPGAGSISEGVWRGWGGVGCGGGVDTDYLMAAHGKCIEWPVFGELLLDGDRGHILFIYLLCQRANYKV